MSSVEKVRLGELITKAAVERCGDRSFPVYSMTMHDGIVEQAGRFKKAIASKDTSAYKVVRKDQLVVGFPIDEGVIYVQNFDKPGIMSPAYNVWDIDLGKVDPRYLELALHSPQSMAYYAEKMRGTTARRRTLTASGLCSLQIPLPSKDEQLKIINAMIGVKNLIESAKQQITQLDQLVKSRFVEMFGDGTHPTVKLANLALSMRNGLSPSKGGCHHAKVLTLSAITQGAFDATAWKEGAFAVEPPADKRVSNDDFYVCRGNGNKQLVGAGDYSPIPMNDLVFPDTVIAVKINQSQVVMPFLKYAWGRSAVRKQIESSAKTTNGTFKINQTALGNIEVPLPPLALQQDFATFVTQVDKTRAIAQQQIDKLQTLYDSLAQDYFA